MLLKSDTERERPPGQERGEASSGPGKGRRIRCPKCRWEPPKELRWACRCGHLWNTFDTSGLCPACQYRWVNTQCPRCHEWSPHEDWYEP